MQQSWVGWKAIFPCVSSLDKLARYHYFLIRMCECLLLTPLKLDLKQHYLLYN